MHKFTIIGSGSAYGVPVVGGNWGACDPKNPKNRRTGPSVLVESAATKILIDMSADFRDQSERHNIREIDAVLFTHGHADHIMGNFHVPMMMRYFNERDLPLYALPETRAEIEKVFWYQYAGHAKVNYSGAGRTAWREIVPYERFTVGDIDILPLAQMHGGITSLGFRVGDVAYSTDFNDFPDKTWEMLQGLDTWIVECNSLRKKEKSVEHKHQYLDNVLSLVDRLRPKQTWLTHMDTTMDYDTVSAILPAGVCMAWDGAEIIS